MIPRLTDVTVVGPNADDVLSWEKTSSMGVARYGSDGSILCPHSKAGQWPRIQIADDGTQAEGNLWGIALAPDGRWYARTLHYLRPGQTTKTYPVGDWGDDRLAMPWPRSHVIKSGEVVGLFVSTKARYGAPLPHERSGVVWLKVDGDIVEREGAGAPPVPDPVPTPDPPPAPVPVGCACAEQLGAILAELKIQRAAVEQAVVEVKAAKEQILPALLGGIKIRF